MLHLANELLMHHFTLEPWYHVKTELEHFARIHWGDRISVRARVVQAYERNQNQLAANAYRKKGEAKSGRGGRSLLIGLLTCGRCGRRCRSARSAP